MRSRIGPVEARAAEHNIDLVLERMVALGWAKRERDSRVVTFSRSGEKAVRELFRLPAVF